MEGIQNNQNSQIPRITIVMLNYNGMKYLPRSIPSVLQLSYPNYNFIIVDNGSTDGSCEYIENIDSATLVHSPRIGEKNYSCNLGIEHATDAEYILLLDNDIIISETSLLENLLELYADLEPEGSVTLSYHHEDEEECIGYGAYFCPYFKNNNRRLRISEYSKLHGEYVGYPQGIGIFIKKSIWDEMGGYDPYLRFGGDDKDLGLRLWQGGYANYLYSRTAHVHIGMPERTDNRKYSHKFYLHVFADLYTITKNFKKRNMMVLIPGYLSFMFLKSIKQSVERKRPGPCISYFKGFFRYLYCMPHAIKMRKSIQSKRVVDKDISLTIRPPRIRKGFITTPKPEMKAEKILQIDKVIDKVYEESTVKK